MEPTAARMCCVSSHAWRHAPLPVRLLSPPFHSHDSDTPDTPELHAAILQPLYARCVDIDAQVASYLSLLSKLLTQGCPDGSSGIIGATLGSTQVQPTLHTRGLSPPTHLQPSHSPAALPLTCSPPAPRAAVAALRRMHASSLRRAVLATSSTLPAALLALETACVPSPSLRPPPRLLVCTALLSGSPSVVARMAAILAL
jgi:hypothetical protein